LNLSIGALRGGRSQRTAQSDVGRKRSPTLVLSYEALDLVDARHCPTVACRNVLQAVAARTVRVRTCPRNRKFPLKGPRP
jgi:hypothetical protein